MTDTRTRIMDAAQALLSEHGPSAFTLEAVAREANVSKGGLLYHFASKEALVRAMVAHYIDLYDERLRAAIENQPEGPGRLTRALLETKLEDSGLHTQYKRALFSLATSHPEVMEPFGAYVEQWLEGLMEDGLPPGLAEVVCFAADGIWFGEMLGLMEVPERHRRRVVGCLERLTDLDSEGAASADRG